MNAVDAKWYVGRTATDQAGRTIGRISQVFMNEQTGRLDWISVTTGLFGGRDNFAPLAGSRVQGDDVVLLVDRQLVQNSPNSATTDHLGKEEQKALTAYYRPFLRRIHRKPPGTAARPTIEAK